MNVILKWMLMFCVLCFSVNAGVGVGDSLQISIKGVPSSDANQVDGVYRVGESGKIKLPLTGEMVYVKGLTNEQVSRKIEVSYKEGKIYKEPVVETIVLGVDKPKELTLSVGGQVRRPGPVMWRKGMTVQQALQAAGDKTKFGSKYVFLTRKGERYKLDTSKLKVQNSVVLANDTLTVKEVSAWGDY